MEWFVIYNQESTENTFIEDILLFLFQFFFSIDPDSSSLPLHSFNPHSILLSILANSIWSTKKFDFFCCEERSVLFWKFLSLSSMCPFHFTRLHGMAVIRDMFEVWKESEVVGMWRVWDLGCVVMKMGKNRERKELFENWCCGS
jgi:hypothetical protein